MKNLRLFLASLALALPLTLAAVAYAAPDQDGGTGASAAPTTTIVAAPTASGTSTPTSAQEQACMGSNGNINANGDCVGSGTPLFGTKGTFTAVINLLIFIVGAVSVLMIIVGGLRYVLSGGDSAGVKGAKDTILYAIIGVIVAIIAYALVNFVIGRLT